MSTFIYSAKVTLDKPYEDKNRIEKIGFYPFSSADPDAPREPAVIRWCEADINNNYWAPIIIEVGDIETSYEIDSPVVQNSQVSLTLDNINKIHVLLLNEGVSLVGQTIEIFLNEFDPILGALMSSTVVFSGSIVNTNFTEEDFFITCEKNKYSRKSKVLKEGELLTVGKSSDNSLFALKRIDTTERPKKEIVTFGGAQSFLLLGHRAANTEDYKIKHFYQIYIPFDFTTTPDEYNKIIGSWMYIVGSTTDSKGQYKKVVRASPIPRSEVASSFNTYFPEIGYYLEVEVEDYYVNFQMATKINSTLNDVDMKTFVQFIRLNFEYYVSKEDIASSTVDKVFVKSDDNYLPIERTSTNGVYWDLNYSITQNNTILLNPSYVLDENTILTYSIIPCNGLAFIDEPNLSKWQSEKVDTTKLFGKMFALQKFALGSYYDPATTTASVSTTPQLIGPEYATDRILNFSNEVPTYTQYTRSYKANQQTILGLEFTPPAIPDNFTFSSVYLGVVLASRCEKGLIDPGVKIMSREIYGNAKEIVTIPLKQNIDSLGGGLISTIPPKYYRFYLPPDDYMYQDWQVEYLKNPNGSEDSYTTRFTNYRKLKIDADSVESYRSIDKIGIFFSRDVTGSSFIYDRIFVHELCIIFEHENNVEELYV